ncbi:MAG TPA: PDZ domain-containing protein, partial [Mycobacteriales bacterium]|nr:PDZ domain-containing protein [Mycobacteriales bacterium]
VSSPSAETAYLRYPSIRGDRVAFIAEDDVWLGAADGGRAWRLTADAVPVAGTRLSPDGATVAYTSTRDGAPEVHVVSVDGGPARRLSHWGDPFTKVAGWLPDGRVVASTAVGEPFRSRVWAWALPLDGGVPERLPLGPTTVVSTRAGGGTVLGVDQRRAGATWKRYRGGTAPKLWIDADGSGEFSRFLRELDGQLEDPDWLGDRVVFLSDHEGWANVYSALPDGSDLRRHTDHGESYARALRTDGTRAVYQRLGEVWLLDGLDPAGQPRRLEISLAGPRTGRQPHPVPARDWLGDMAPDRTGRATALEVLGTVHWLTSRDGPAPALVDQPGVRARLPRVLGPAAGTAASGTAVPEVAWVTDADGDDALEVGPADGSAPPRRLAGGQLGRVLELVAAPDGRSLAAASHDGRVLVVDVASGEVREIARTGHEDASGLTFSPDSAWLAWSHPGAEGLAQIRAARVADGAGGQTVEITRLRFRDTSPVFTLDGQHLAFLSTRTFDPVYDELFFDLSFPGATRPYLVPLAATTPSPFHPEPGGRPAGGGPAGPGGSGPGGEGEDDAPPQPVTLDPEAIEQRVIAVPVATARARALSAVQGGLVWLEDPQRGLLGEDRPAADGEPARPRLLRYDFAKRRSVTLADEVDGFRVSGDGKRLLLRDDKSLRVVPADRRVDPDEEGDRDAIVEVDLRRLRVQVDPAAQWRQMFDEAGRLMRDHYWIADMAGVDWDGVLERYRPVVERVATRDDLSELFWEVVGELGSSHAYESPPPVPVPPGRALGFLGADLARDGDRWVVRRVLPGESSVRGARSPLSSPGVAVRAGDAILAVDGRPVDPAVGPAPLLAGAAAVPVELTVQPGDASEVRRVVVVPLEDERALRYQAWVADRRAAVHEASGGRVGYLHVPDMVASGWAQLHRDLILEVARDGLVVDVRDNNGGHVSELVLEKLARRVQGWDTTRHGPPTTYPSNSPRGPMVLVANEHAGSDGDIVTAGFKQLRLGPVVGMRTWGGVIGIDGRYTLVDGTSVTQPRYSFWFRDAGWDVENYGVDPDVEVPIPPQDWAAGRDPQLDTAVRMVLEALEREPAARPPDPATR